MDPTANQTNTNQASPTNSGVPSAPGPSTPGYTPFKIEENSFPPSSDNLAFQSSAADSPPPSSDVPAGSGNGSTRKIIAGVLGAFLLVGGVGAGVILVGQQQNIERRATSEPTPIVSASCQDIKIFDEEWNPISADGLKALSPGDVIRITVVGLATSGSFDMARFTINGTLRPEVTQKRPGTEEFFDEYTIPVGVSTFNIKAEIHHSSNIWI